MGAGRSGQAGFTLVEMLVSLALLGMAAVLVGQGLASDRAGLGRITLRTSRGEEVAAAQDLIRDRLEHLFPRSRVEADHNVVDFEGRGDSLRFLTSNSAAMAGGQVRAMSVGLDGQAELVSGPDPAEGGAGAVVLLRGVKGLEIAYWGPDETGSTLAWRESWAHRTAPPVLVRMRVAFAAGDARRWPDLIVRPGAVVDTDCVLDDATGGCRGQS